MIEGDFVVSDDFVVEVCDVESAIGTELQVDRSEPRVVGGKQVRLFDRFSGRTVVFKPVSIDSACHHIAAQEVRLEGGWEVGRLDVCKPRDGGASMQVIHGWW